jgi:hypothetical protein
MDIRASYEFRRRRPPDGDGCGAIIGRVGSAVKIPCSYRVILSPTVTPVECTS